MNKDSPHFRKRFWANHPEATVVVWDKSIRDFRAFSSVSHYEEWLASREFTGRLLAPELPLTYSPQKEDSDAANQ